MFLQISLKLVLKAAFLVDRQSSKQLIWLKRGFKTAHLVQGWFKACFESSVPGRGMISCATYLVED